MKTIFFTADRRPGSASRSTCSRRAAAAPAPSSRRPRASSRSRPSSSPPCRYAGMSLHKVSSQVRHLRRDRRQHAGEDRRAGRGDHREPVRGGGLPEPRHADQGQHADAGGAAAGRPEPVLPGLQEAWRHHLAQAVGAAQGGAARRARDPASLILVPDGGALLRVPRLRRDRRGRGRRASGVYQGRDRLRWWIDEGQHGAEGQGRAAGRWSPARTIWPRSSAATTASAPRPPALPRAGAGGGPVAGRLRLRQHHRQGGRALARARAALHLLRAVEGQSDRGRPVAVPPGARGRASRDVGGARADRLRQGPAEGRRSAPTSAWSRRWPTPPPRCTSSPTPT